MPSTARHIIDCANLSTIWCIRLAWAWRTLRHSSDSSHLQTWLLTLFDMPPCITGIRWQTYISTSGESRSTRNWVWVLSIYSPCCMLTPLSPTTTGNFLLNNYKQAIQIIKTIFWGFVPGNSTWVSATKTLMGGLRMRGNSWRVWRRNPKNMSWPVHMSKLFKLIKKPSKWMPPSLPSDMSHTT